MQHYHVITLNGIDPLFTGYPTNKARFAMLGVRSDFSSEMQLRATVTKIFNNPLTCERDFRQLLGMGSDEFKWERLHKLPTAEEIHFLQGTNCTCSLNPMATCSVHACQCRKCSSTEPLACVWRNHAMEYLKKHDLMDLLEPEQMAKVTYVQAIELKGGVAVKSPRERNILNIVSYLPQVLDLGVFDLSQGINYIILKMNGTP